MNRMWPKTLLLNVRLQLCEFFYSYDIQYTKNLNSEPISTHSIAALQQCCLKQAWWMVGKLAKGVLEFIVARLSDGVCC